jgi:hypothetical protein
MTGTLPVTRAGAGPGEGGGEAGSLVECGFEHAERIRTATIATARRSGACMTVRATSIPSILIMVFEGRPMGGHLSRQVHWPGRPDRPDRSNTVGRFYGWVALGGLSCQFNGRHEQALPFGTTTGGRDGRSAAPARPCAATRAILGRVAAGRCIMLIHTGTEPACVIVAPTGLRRVHRNASETTSTATRHTSSERRGVDDCTKRQQGPISAAAAASQRRGKELVGSRNVPAVRAVERAPHRPVRNVPRPLSAMRRLPADLCCARLSSVEFE